MENNSVMRKIMPITSVILPQNYLENYGEYLIISGLFPKTGLAKGVGNVQFFFAPRCSPKQAWLPEPSGFLRRICSRLKLYSRRGKTRNNIIMLWEYYALHVTCPKTIPLQMFIPSTPPFNSGSAPGFIAGGPRCALPALSVPHQIDDLRYSCPSG